MNLMKRRRALMSKNKPETFLATPKYFQLGSDISTNAFAAQGACYYNGAIYFIVVTSDSSTQYLYSYSVATGTTSLLQTYTTLGHANSMTYVPSKNAFYVATQDADLGIAVIDDSSYEKTNNIILYNPDTGNKVIPYCIAWDQTRNVLYDNRGSFCRVFDADGNYIRRLDFRGYVSGNVEQGLETDGQFIYKIWHNPNKIDVYTVYGSYVSTIDMSWNTEELEELVYDWSGRFYASFFKSSGKQQLFSLLFRTFNHFLNVSYTALSVWAPAQNGGTIGRWGAGNLTFTSSASKSYSLLIYGKGYPYSYEYLKGKKCRISFDVTRRSGSSGSVIVSLYTTNSATDIGTNVIYQYTKGKTIPAADEEHYESEFIAGDTGLTPATGQEGAYVGYRIFLYADSGNACWVKNFKFEVEV